MRAIRSNMPPLRAVRDFIRLFNSPGFIAVVAIALALLFVFRPRIGDVSGLALLIFISGLVPLGFRGYRAIGLGILVALGLCILLPVGFCFAMLRI